MAPLQVPLYSQTAEFSCGAACLVMALNALEGLPLSRSSEFELWREATMVGIRGIDQWGLSVPALSRGVPVAVVSEAEQTFPGLDPEEIAARRRELAERYPEDELAVFSPQDLEIARFIQQENRRRARAAGVEWVEREPNLGDIRSALDSGAVPILLVDLERLGGGWPAPHWVVATDVDGDGHDDEVTVHDPDDQGPGRRTLVWKELWGAMDVSEYDAVPTIVVVGDWGLGGQGSPPSSS